MKHTYKNFEIDQVHSDRHPHWSDSVEWRAGRWDPMINAPSRGRVVHVRGRDEAGKILEPMHYADGGGEECPPYRGWFVPYSGNLDELGSGFYEVVPVAWQPLRAKPEEEANV